MSLDRQRYTAVRLLEALGFRWDGREWLAPVDFVGEPHLAAVVSAADAMHAELTGQIEDLAGAADTSTLDRLVELAQAYEAARPRD